MKSITFNLEAKPQRAVVCAPCNVSVGSAPSPFVFTLGKVGAVGAGAVLKGVAMIAPTSISNKAILMSTALQHKKSRQQEMQKYADQYSVGNPSIRKMGCDRFCELFHGVAISNTVYDKGHISSLLGKTGHYERMSFWTHFVAAFLFGLYSIVRQVLSNGDERLAGGLTTAAGWTISGVFFTSSIYHFTAPDISFAMVTRVLDYAAIYIGITVTTTADIAVATRGFVNVPGQTIADLPVAASLLIIFFIWRRCRLPGEYTWTSHGVVSQSNDDCVLSRGLFSYGHRDLAHIQMRQSTSLLLFGSYFMIVPAAMEVLGHDVARVVLALQVSAFVTVAFGMAIDRVFEFPNKNLVEGSMSCMACPNTIGAVMNSHALWHVVAAFSAALTVISREYALVNS